MLTELLRLAGVDLAAHVRVWKIEAEDKAQQVAARVWRRATHLALVMACFAAAGLLGFMAFLVLLILLYRGLAAAWGEWAALSVVAMLLCILGLGLALLGATLGRRRPVLDHILFASPLAADLGPAPLVDAIPGEPGRTLPHFVLPLFAFVSRYAPLTGNWAVDGALRHFVSRTPATTTRAIEQAAQMVRHGSRPTMLAILGSAGLLGWLMLRPRK